MREFFRETRNFDEATRYLKIERSNFYKMTREELFAVTRTSKSFTVRIEHRKKDKVVIQIPYSKELRKKLISAISFKPLSEPELEEIEDIFNIDLIKKRLKIGQYIKWCSCKVSCKRLKGEIREQTWVRNFKVTLALLLIIIKNIAELLVYYKTET